MTLCLDSGCLLELGASSSATGTCGLARGINLREPRQWRRSTVNWPVFLAGLEDDWQKVSSRVEGWYYGWCGLLLDRWCLPKIFFILLDAIFLS